MRKKLNFTLCQVKNNKGVRIGRGFSPKELVEAKMNVFQAKHLNLPVDKRRKSSHPNNVQTLLDLKGTKS